MSLPSWAIGEPFTPAADTQHERRKRRKKTITFESLIGPGQRLARFSHFPVSADSKLLTNQNWPSQIPHPSFFFPLPEPKEIISETMARDRHKAFVEDCIMRKLRKHAPSEISPVVDSDLSEEVMSSIDDITDLATPEPTVQKKADLDQLYRDICASEFKARFKIPLQVLKTLERALRQQGSSSRPNWTRTLSCILHMFLSDNSIWKCWAEYANRLDEEEWANSAEKHKVPILLYDRFTEFRDGYGIQHSYRVMLPAILWALHVGCESVGLPPKSKRPSANKL